MEWKLNSAKIQYYRCVLEEELLSEETGEAIVPDSKADIAEVVDTDGYFLLEDRSAGEGTYTVSGTLAATVLYRPDGEGTLCSMGVSVPFRFCVRNEALKLSCSVEPAFFLKTLETRVLNPRKVLVRAELCLRVSCFDACALELPTGVEAPDGVRLEELREDTTVTCVTGMQEKPVTVQDELTVSAAPESLRELLLVHPDILDYETRTVGTRAVVKGTFQLLALFAMEGEDPHAETFRIPFSQVMDVGEQEGDREPRLNFCLEDVTCRFSERQLQVSCTALVQAEMTSETPVSLLRDVYSIDAATEVQRREAALTGRVESTDSLQNLRASVGTGTGVRSVLCAWLVPKQNTCERGENSAAVRTVSEAHVLYLPETGGCSCARAEVSGEMSVPCGETDRLRVCGKGSGELFASPGADGIDLRGSRAVLTERAETETVSAISAVSASETETDGTPGPSVILRRVAEGETLWALAKAARTTGKAICDANQIGEGDVAPGVLLLIPRAGK